MDNTEKTMNSPLLVYDFVKELHRVFDYGMLGKTRITEDIENEQVTEIINTGQLNKTVIIEDIEHVTEIINTDQLNKTVIIEDIENEQVTEIINTDQQVKTRPSKKKRRRTSRAL